MQQRRLRLGDILDDYCPRERRITNHAVVAMIEDEIRQTRCTTCDTEHEFKQAKMPTLRKKKESVSAAYKEVLAGVVKDAPPTGAPPAPAAAPSASTPEPERAIAPEPPAPREATPESPAAARGPDPEPEHVEAIAQGEHDDAEGVDGGETEAGRVHRRLIRAQLPRPENHQVVRPVPEFTMRQPTGRAGKFRPAGARAPRPAAGRGNMNTGGRGGGFARPVTGRGGQAGRVTGRADAHRPRGGQPPRHGKKHSK